VETSQRVPEKWATHVPFAAFSLTRRYRELEPTKRGAVLSPRELAERRAIELSKPFVTGCGDVPARTTLE